MSTVQEIIDFADRMFLNSETTANKIKDLNDIYVDLYVSLNRLKNDIEITNLSSVADLAIYTLPSNCRIENIEDVLISTSTSGTEFESVSYAGIKDDITSGKYYGRASESTFFLFEDGLPVQTTGLIIYIYYYKRPTLLDSNNLSAIPELDVDYHDLLKSGLIQSLASQGPNPETGTADYWQAKYDEKLKKVTNALSERYNTASTQRSQVRERM